MSSGGLFEHGDELPDLTKAGKFFASSLIIHCLPAILVTGWTTHESWIPGKVKRFSSSPRGSDQLSNSSSLYSICIWVFFRWELSGRSVKQTTDVQKVPMSRCMDLDIHFLIHLHGRTDTISLSVAFICSMRKIANTLSSVFWSVFFSRSLTDSTGFVVYICEPIP